jgi:hypothetical protein
MGVKKGVKHFVLGVKGGVKHFVLGVKEGVIATRGKNIL